MLYYERKLKKEGFDFIIGVDEAGRGPLAGPVVAAAVVLKTFSFKNRIDDSKKLSPLLRDKAFPEIIDKSIFGIGIIGEKIVDRLNILRATYLAMEEAVNSLIKKINPLSKSRIHIIVDGNMAPSFGFACTPIIKGDAKSKSIAAASILAKVTRDRIMDNYHKIYPQYGFLKHKGYPTAAHRQALKKFGPSLIHRKSFHCG
ncbi:MAG: ribonuclease HII [Candidatus Omnitrophota bacterium]